MTTVLVGLVMLVGLLGVIVPLLPGTALVLAAGVAWAVLVVADGSTRWVVVGVMAALFLAGLVLKYALPGRHLAGRLPSPPASSWSPPGCSGSCSSSRPPAQEWKRTASSATSSSASPASRARTSSQTSPTGSAPTSAKVARSRSIPTSMSSPRRSIRPSV